MPLISVIVPVYDPGPCLQDCLASLDAQTCRDFEVVLVDDGSSDGSPEACDRYAAQCAQARAVHGPNQGPLLARREGMHQASGSYLMFLDADDCLRPDAIEVVADAIAESGADIICFGYAQGASERYDADASACTALGAGLYRGEDYEEVRLAACSGLFNSLCDKAFRRSLVDLDDDYAAWQGLRHGEDLFQLVPLIEAAQSLERLDEVLYFYRENPASSTHSYRASRIDDLTIACDRLSAAARRWGDDCACEARCMACRHARWLLGDLVVSGWPACDQLREAERISAFLRRYCGDGISDALASLRLDLRLPVSLLAAGKPKAALCSVRALDGAYRGACRIAGKGR